MDRQQQHQQSGQFDFSQDSLLPTESFDSKSQHHQIPTSSTGLYFPTSSTWPLYTPHTMSQQQHGISQIDSVSKSDSVSSTQTSFDARTSIASPMSSLPSPVFLDSTSRGEGMNTSAPHRVSPQMAS